MSELEALNIGVLRDGAARARVGSAFSGSVATVAAVAAAVAVSSATEMVNRRIRNTIVVRVKALKKAV